MFSCPGCWDNPCTCGNQFEHFTDAKLREQINTLQGMLNKRAIAAGKGLPEGMIDFKEGLNVAELKEFINGLPEVDAQGNPFKVLVCSTSPAGFTVPASHVVIEKTERLLKDGTKGSQITIHD